MAGVDPARPIPAAVLALLYPGTSEPHLVLTRRTTRVAAHKGQICLPGGVLAPGETALDAALRETREEIGVDAAALRVIGRLTPIFIPVSGFRMEPFVAIARKRPRFSLAADEVAALLELPLHRLLDPAARGERSVARDDTNAVIPYFLFDGHEVWGATAMVLAELAVLLAEVAGG